jgi:hypothetical protein
MLEKAEHSSSALALKATGRDTLRWKVASLMDKSWFDRESGTLLLDNHAVELGPYQRIVENEMTTDAELDEQTQRATSLLRAL